jgi:hypothetical protein
MLKTDRAVKSSSSSSLSSLQRHIEGSRIPIRTISNDKISSSTSKISSSHSFSASNQQEQIIQPNESNLRNKCNKDQLQMTNPSHNSEFDATSIKRKLNDEASKDEVINKIRNKN